MAKIRKLKISDIKKFQEMIEYISSGLLTNQAYETIFRLLPFADLHNLLPIHMKFLQECYVAVEGKNLLGLISLIPDCKLKTRWRINRLVLNADAYEAGKQLIDYVVNKYGGAGVETFLAIIDENRAETINLFKDACNFRSGAKIYIWEKDSLTEQKLPENPNLFKEFKCSDAKKLQELDQQSLFPQFRTSLAKEEADFNFGIKNILLNQFRGYKVRRLILDNPYHKSIEGYIMIMTKDNVNFWADIVLSLAYQDYYEEIFNYIINYINFQNKNAKLYVYVREYYQSNKKMSKTLMNLNFKKNQGFQVLVKDYWKTIKAPEEGKKSPIILFPDITSPACNNISDLF